MWFFDTVLEENTSTASGTSITKSQKNDEQDGAFLIVDDSLSASDIPDTAVKLFDEESAAEPTVSAETPTNNVEISFFSETPASTDEVTKATEDVVVTELEAITEDIQAETSVVPEIVSEDYTQSTSASTETYDIFAPVRKAIAEYSEYIADRTKLADVKDQEIVECNARIAQETSERNARIAAEKAAAKAALDERKKIEAEIDRAKQMQAVFTAQLEK
ncbi:MAG: hypothetical protein ACD_78C00206G0003 [uncultured bacterium (gcode 4)]|uniref:Uncharacterized protein n=1 Tax=uncultured bacterium (gcode 4) TaxID=1234023 RepID=K1YX57_9BACT|nr:MAG: hypothetical protein ACD_78C00206G0003 [uncultured bacterium (gcode 4)]